LTVAPRTNTLRGGIGDKRPNWVEQLEVIMPQDNDERRIFQRKSMDVPGTLMLSGVNGPPMSGSIVNVSIGGFLFNQAMDVPQGVRGTLRLDGTDIDVLIEVVGRSEQGTHLRVTEDDQSLTQLAAESDIVASLLLPIIYPEE
jgi:hypothetical protein